MKWWTKDEVDFLEDKWGTYSLKAIAKHLNRSTEAVKLKAQRMGLSNGSLAFDGITLNQLMVALNKDYGYTANAWIERYNMPVRTKVFAIKKRVKVITYADFWKWAEQHKTLINFAKVEENILGPEPAWVKKKRDADQLAFQKSKVALEWTKADDQRLLQLVKHDGMTYTKLSKMFNRTESAIKRRLSDLNCKFRPERLNNHIKYTEDETKTLIEMAEAGYSYETIAQRIGKGALGVRGKLERMNFDFKRRKFKSNVG